MTMHHQDCQCGSLSKSEAHEIKNKTLSAYWDVPKSIDDFQAYKNIIIMCDPEGFWRWKRFDSHSLIFFLSPPFIPQRFKTFIVNLAFSWLFSVFYYASYSPFFKQPDRIFRKYSMKGLKMYAAKVVDIFHLTKSSAQHRYIAYALFFDWWSFYSSLNSASCVERHLRTQILLQRQNH